MCLSKRLWNDEGGLILSAELVLVLTIGVLAMIVGLNAVAGTLNRELNDISSAFGTINQSFGYDGFVKPNGFGGVHSYVSGSAFIDRADFCDCSQIVDVFAVAKVDGAVVGVDVGPGPGVGPSRFDGPGPDFAPPVPCDDCPMVPNAPPTGPTPVPMQELPAPEHRLPQPCEGPDCR